MPSWTIALIIPLAALLPLTVQAADVGKPTPANVLVIYNSAASGNPNYADIDESREIARYYQAKRPGSHLLDLLIPDSARLGTYGEEMSRDAYIQFIRDPIIAWLDAHADLDIRYLALAKGVPLKIQGSAVQCGQMDSGAWASVDSELMAMRDDAGNAYRASRAGYSQVPNPYFRADTDFRAVDRRFAPRTFRNSMISLDVLVTRLDGYTVGEVQAMIDRALRPASSPRQWVLDDSPIAAGHGWSEMPETQAALRTIGIADDEITYEATASRIVSSRDVNRHPVIAYVSHGVYSGFPADWPLNSLGFSFANGAVTSTYESFNGFGFADPRQSAHGQAAEFIRAGASGAIGNVYEPCASAIATEAIWMPAYAAGYPWAEAAYMSLPYASWVSVVVGDPLMAIAQPKLSAARAMSQTTVRVTSSETLLGDTAPSDWTVNGNAISAVSRSSDNSWDLLLAQPLPTNASLTVRYLGRGLANADGLLLSGEALTAQDSQPPLLVAAQAIDRFTIQLSFSEILGAIAAADFQISESAIARVELHGANATLRLAKPLISHRPQVGVITNAQGTRDQAGNLIASPAVLIAEDRIAPAIAISQPSSGSSFNTPLLRYTLDEHLVSGTLRWVARPVARERYEARGPSARLRAGTRQVATYERQLSGTELAAGEHEISLLQTGEGLADGIAYTIAITGQDAAGNRGSGEALEVTYDITPPQDVSFTAPAQANRPDLTLTLTGSDANAVWLSGDLEPGASVGRWIPLTLSITVNLTGGDGQKALLAKFRDAAGNETDWMKHAVRYQFNPKVSDDVPLSKGERGIRRSIDTPIETPSPLAKGADDGRSSAAKVIASPQQTQQLNLDALPRRFWPKLPAGFGKRISPIYQFVLLSEDGKPVHGKLAAPATVQIRYDESKGGFSSSAKATADRETRPNGDVRRLTMLRYDVKAKQWKVLPTTVNASAQTATAKTSRTGLFAVAITQQGNLTTRVQQ